jgi:hypothetical protein
MRERWPELAFGLIPFYLHTGKISDSWENIPRMNPKESTVSQAPAASAESC